MISRLSLSAFLVLLIENGFIVSNAVDWNYQNTDWKTTIPTCGGNKQSPLDLQPGNATKSTKPKVILTGDAGTTEWPATADGHSLKIDLTSASFKMDLGKDDGQNWKLDSYHFHWNDDSTAGSEHLISGKAFPLEMHLVHYNGKYSKLSEAISSGDSNALAVLGIFFSESTASSADNLASKMLPVDFANLAAVDGSTTVKKFKLSEVITRQASLDKFYRYQGSLTTPTCNEIVTWTVLTETLPITAKQLADIRSVKLKDDDVRNFRPVQEVGGRTIFLNSGNSLKGSKFLQSVMTIMAITMIYSRI